MNYRNKTREDLVNEISKLEKILKKTREEYGKEILLLKPVDERVKYKENTLRKAFMLSPDSININRFADGLYVFINEGFTRIMGYSEEEILGKTSLEMDIWVDPDDRKILLKELQAKGEVKNFEARFKAKDKTIKNGAMSASLIDLNGVSHILNVTRDITGLRQANEALSQEKFLMDTIMDNLPDYIYFKDRESRFIRMNKAQARFFGLDDPSQAVGKTDFDFFTKEHAQQAYEDEQTIIRTGQWMKKEEKETHHNVPDTWASTIKMPLRDKEGNIIGTFGMSRDVTERKLADEEIKHKNELLQSINAEKDKFFSFLAHDLREPLSNFVAATQILTEEIQTMSLDEIRELTVSMKISASSIYCLLENLLEWSYFKRGVLEFTPKMHNLKNIVQNSIEVVSESVGKKNIVIDFSIADDLRVYIDKHMFESVIRNLVSNAVKFTPRGGKIIISASAVNDNFIKLKISDTGIGMNTELKSKLFLLSEKTSRPGTEGEPSTGLGLLLCKDFIEKNGGKIWVESEEGKGSAFSITIRQSEKALT